MQDYLDITFLNERSEFNRILKKMTWEIAPYKSKSQDDWDWRFQLKENDEVDACDNYCIWYKSTIINKRVEIENE